MAKKDYEVGYGKPPQNTRFTEGKSGNPKGRPKGKRNLSTIVDMVINEKVVINENGRKRTVTKMHASLKQALNKAASGDLPSLRFMVQMTQAAEGAKANGNMTLFNNEDDNQILSQLLKRTQSEKLGTGANPDPAKTDNEDNKND